MPRVPGVVVTGLRVSKIGARLIQLFYSITFTTFYHFFSSHHIYDRLYGEQAARCPVRVAAVGLELDKLSEGDPLRHPMCFLIQGRYLLILAICQTSDTAALLRLLSPGEH